MKIGDRVYICGSHPWRGTVAECIGFGTTFLSEMPAAKMRNDNGDEFFVFRDDQYQMLPKEPAKRKRKKAVK